MSNSTEQAAPSADAETAQVEELVRRAQSGDRAAFDELIVTFQQRMFNLAYRMTGNREDAADMTQEIFVKLYRSIGKFGGRSKFSTWLYTLAANTCRSGLRRLGRISRAEAVHMDAHDDSSRGAIWELPDPGQMPDRSAELGEMKAQIETAIAALPEEFRMVVVLRDVQGLAYDEIADVLSCSMGTVKSRLARARLRLKERLTREGLVCAVKR